MALTEEILGGLALVPYRRGRIFGKGGRTAPGKEERWAWQTTRNRVQLVQAFQGSSRSRGCGPGERGQAGLGAGPRNSSCLPPMGAGVRVQLRSKRLV